MTINQALEFVDGDCTTGGQSTQDSLRVLADEVRRLRVNDSPCSARVFREFIIERKPKVLNPEWVLWMLGVIERWSKNGLYISPEWLRASHVHFIYASGQTSEEEPQMEIEL